MPDKIKKKKRRSRLRRFIVLIIFIALIGTFIFYSIDNPGFISGLFDRGDDGNGESVEINNSAEESSAEEDDVPDIPSLWSRILAFFERGAADTESEDTYSSSLLINIYFAGTGQEKILVAEERKVIAGNPGNALANAMNEILRGPLMSYHFPVIPAGTRLLSSRVIDGIAEIDLSQEFLDNSLDSRILDEYIIYSIVNTVTEIPDINGATFFIEGKKIKVYGSIDLSIPAIRKEELLIQEQ